MCEGSSTVKLNSTTRLFCDTMRSLVKQYCDLGMWTAALFYADKLNALNGSGIEDEVYMVANCMLQKGEYHRAAHTITSRGLHKFHLMSYYVACKALLEAKEYQEAIQLMDEVEPDNLLHTMSDPPKNRVLGAVAVVKGRALGAMDRRTGAGNSFLQALHKDVFCYEALDYLTRHHMLTPEQEVELLENLPFEAQCNKSEITLMKLLYQNELNRYGSEEKEFKLSLASSTVPQSCGTAVNRLIEYSSDVIEGRARHLLRRGDFEDCLQALGPPEGDSERAAELRTACLAELKRPPALFSLAHRLVDKYPQSATSWFAVGCYYYITGKSEFARRYLSKATSLDRGMGAAWLAYGHSFAADNEHDQAMAAYFKASQLMSGCHLPLLYIGLECGLTNNPKMADKFFQQALVLAPNDAHVTHEMGVIAFQNQQYDEAEKLWRSALTEVYSITKGKMINKRWQPLLNNLGHVCRKNKKYIEAIGFHEHALTIVPGCGSTYSALGLCFALIGQMERAMDAFHAALSKRPDESFATTMVKYLVEELSDQANLFLEAIPEFPFPENIDLSIVKPVDKADRNKSEYNVTCTSDMSMSFD